MLERRPILQHRVSYLCKMQSVTIINVNIRSNERDSAGFLEDGVAVQSTGCGHVDSMCGDGKSKHKTVEIDLTHTCIHTHRTSVCSTGLTNYMTVYLETCSLSLSYLFYLLLTMR